ncbi:MAG: ParB/RepB/Spo0J family partition protein [Candidatus Uhrbacteria bacterium]|nr:ParB/RepB/Spo0J family partition protein [Candidatus Uhrbacteria bacterium]
MNHPSALGKGLGSLIPQKQSLTERIIPSARKEILEIPPNDIKANPRQPRSHFSQSELEDLIASIKEHGIMQPLVVTRSNGEYELIAGERRLRSARALGLETVPVIVREANEQQKLELALIENIQRQDLNAVEEAIAYKALIDEFNLKQDEVALRVGKSRSNVANIIRLLDLPSDILDALKEGRISKSHARTLLAETDSKKQHDLFEQMLNGGVTVRQTEARVTGITTKRSVSIGKDPNIAAHEKKLREILGTKVDITESNGKGKIEITFYSRPELMDLLELLSEKK